MCQPSLSKFPPVRTFPLIVAAIAFLTADLALGGQPAGGQPAATREPTPPSRGSIYVDVETDNTGSVAHLVFLNKVAPEVQEWLKKETLGHHFGLPGHTYRRHIEYERINGRYYSR